MRGEDHRSILLAQGLQPFAELAGEPLVVEREPAFIDDQQRRTPVETRLDAMEEIGKNRRSSPGPDQALRLEYLDSAVAEPLGLGVEQAPKGTTQAVRLERALERR